MTGKNRAIFVSVLTLAVGSTITPQTKTAQQDKPALVERGRYIVESVAQCELCHTPRDEQGNPDRGRWLMGGPLQIRATYPNDWATITPRLAGQPPGSDAEVVKLLTTGIWKTGLAPNPPMPQFHMAQADAEAVVAYLKSLGH
jgi:mono/diheme cytochrome c family protein